MPTGRKHLYSDWDLVFAVAESRSLAQVMRKLGMEPRSGCYQALKRNIARLELDTSHFTGQAWSRGMTFPGPLNGRKKSLEELLVRGSRCKSDPLKRRLISEGLKEARCDCCCLTEWNGKAIPLELHHVNGDKYDNRLENLQLLCPNCHSQTPTYRAKNRASVRARSEDATGINGVA